MAIILEIQAYQNPTPGNSDGWVQVGVVSGIGRYWFRMQPSANWITPNPEFVSFYTFPGLPGGTHTFEVLNSTDEIGQISFTLTEPEPEPQPEPPTSYTETITIQVQDCRPGVLLRWLNSLGGVESWLFSGKVNRPFAVEALGEYLQQNGLRAATQKRGTPGMVVRTSGLNLNQYRALCELYTSPAVWVQEGDQETPVYVVPGAVDTDPLRKSYELAVELQFAPVNHLSN